MFYPVSVCALQIVFMIMIMIIMIIMIITQYTNVTDTNRQTDRLVDGHRPKAKRRVIERR